MSRSVEFLLKNATGEQLNFLNQLANHPSFRSFVNLIDKFKLYNIQEVFTFKAPSADALAYFREKKLGEVMGLDQLIDACESAYKEIERRKRLKEGGTNA